MQTQKQLLQCAGIMLIFLNCLQLSSGIPVEISITDNSGTDSVIYDPATGQNQEFARNSLMECACSPNNYKQINYSRNKYNIVSIQNYGEQPIFLSAVNLKLEDNDQCNMKMQFSSAGQIINPQQSIDINQLVTLPSSFNEDNYWLTVSMTLLFDTVSIDVYYIAVFDKSFKPFKFDWALILLITLACILIYIFARFGQVYAYKTTFCGFFIKEWWGILYGVVLIMVALCLHFAPSISQAALDIIMGILSLLASVFFLSEILAVACFKGKSLNTSRIKNLSQIIFFRPLLDFPIRIVDILMLFIGTIIIGCWIFLKKPWFINDIMSVALMSSSIKLCKIRSMKTAGIFMGITLLFDLGMALTIHFSQPESYDTLVLASANQPFEIQIPSFKHILNKKCAWIAITAVVLPGFFLQYLHRFDKSRNSNVYAFLGFLGLLIGSLLMVFVTLWNTHTFPFACFTYPLIFGFVCLFAHKRSETDILWSGDFYDPDLLTPLTVKRLEEEAQREEEQEEQKYEEEQEEEVDSPEDKPFSSVQNEKNEPLIKKFDHFNINSDSQRPNLNPRASKIKSPIKKSRVTIDPSIFAGLSILDDSQANSQSNDF